MWPKRKQTLCQHADRSEGAALRVSLVSIFTQRIHGDTFTGTQMIEQKIKKEYYSTA